MKETSWVKKCWKEKKKKKDGRINMVWRSRLFITGMGRGPRQLRIWGKRKGKIWKAVVKEKKGYSNAKRRG